MKRFKRFLRKTRLKQHISGLTRVEKNARKMNWPTVLEDAYLLKRQAEMELHRLESESNG